MSELNPNAFYVEMRRISVFILAMEHKGNYGRSSFYVFENIS